MPRLNHAALWTADLERAKKFFSTFFGAQAGSQYHNPHTGFRSYFLQFEDGPQLEIMQMEGILPRAVGDGMGSSDGDLAAGKRFPPQTIGIAHLAFSVGSKEAVDALTLRLEEAGYPRLDGPRTTGDGYYESVLLDPDGNRIEITI